MRTLKLQAFCQPTEAQLSSRIRNSISHKYIFTSIILRRLGTVSFSWLLFHLFNCLLLLLLALSLPLPHIFVGLVGLGQSNEFSVHFMLFNLLVCLRFLPRRWCARTASFNMSLITRIRLNKVWCDFFLFSFMFVARSKKMRPNRRQQHTKSNVRQKQLMKRNGLNGWNKEEKYHR